MAQLKSIKFCKKSITEAAKRRKLRKKKKKASRINLSTGEGPTFYMVL